MSLNRRSKHITEGVARAPNRSMYYAMGYEEGDFSKPMVGVANGHSTITPGNSGLQRLADAAVEGLKDAGANPQVFGTPTISDAMAMGTEGMKYSLVSREQGGGAAFPGDRRTQDAGLDRRTGWDESAGA